MELLGETLDPGLNLVQAVQNESLPEHDELYLQTKDAVDESESNEPEAETLDAGDADSENDEADESETDEALTEIDGRLTTPATESIRNDVSYVYVAESFGDEPGLLSKMGSYAGSAAIGISKFAWNILGETAGYLKEIGITYGPGILARIKSTVGLVAGRSLRLSLKLISASIVAYKQKKHSFEKAQKRIQKLKATLSLLDGKPVTLVSPDPFSNQVYYDLFLVNGKAGSIKTSVMSVAKFLGVLKDTIDRGMEHDIRVIEQLIDNTVRGIRFNPIIYLKPLRLEGNFSRKSIQGFASNPEMIDTYVYGEQLPNNTLLVYGLPKDNVIEQAAQSNDISEVTKAYHGSFIVLAANPARSQSQPMVNYVDKDTLLYLLENAEGICAGALQHVELYRQNVKRAERLKTGYRHYFAWLTGMEEQKSLRDSFAELIYLKQTFVTKVYLPAMIDTHDYVALYLNTLLKFVEENIRVLKPQVDDQDSAV